MKKIFVACLVLTMVACMSLNAFALPGAFVESPSNNQAPELIEGTVNCGADVVITAYAQRDTLSEETRKAIEEAYTKIVGTTDISSLNGNIKNIADELKINSTDFVVSDLFSVSYEGCENHKDHGGEFEIVLKSETLKNYAFLMKYHNGEWKIIDNAEINSDGNLVYKDSELAPLAIVAFADGVEVKDSVPVGAIVAGTAAGAAGIGLGWFLIVLLLKKKKIRD